MQYKLNVAFRIDKKTYKPGSIVDVAVLRKGGLDVHSATQKGQVTLLAVENNPDVLRKLHGVKPVQGDPETDLKRDLGTEEVVVDADGNKEAQEKPARAEKTNEGLSGDALSDADEDALVASVMERVTERFDDAAAQLVGEYVRKHDDTKGIAIDFLVADYGDRVKFVEMVQEEVAEIEKSRELALSEAAAKATTPGDKASEARADHEDKRGASYTQTPNE